MPDFSCASGSAIKDTLKKWGTLIIPEECLNIPKRGEQFLHICNTYKNVQLTTFGNLHINPERYVKQIELSVIEAYQLRDFLNKNLDELAYYLVEGDILDKEECTALTKFKKVYYEDEIKNLNKSEETSDNKTEETEVS